MRKLVAYLRHQVVDGGNPLREPTGTSGNHPSTPEDGQRFRWRVRTVRNLALRRYLQNLVDFSPSKEDYQ